MLGMIVRDLALDDAWEDNDRCMCWSLWRSNFVGFFPEHHVTVRRDDLLQPWMQHFFVHVSISVYAIGANKPNTSEAQTTFFNGCAGERREGYFLHLHFESFEVVFLQRRLSPTALVNSRFGPRCVAICSQSWAQQIEHPSCTGEDGHMVLPLFQFESCWNTGNQCVLPCILSWLPERYRS